MRSGLQPMSEADPAAVKRYLAERQIDPEIIEWKYFDARFNRRRERGVVWARENKVAGFLGLIPFCAEKDGVRTECAWSCDWSVDSSQAGGMGLMLVKRARDFYDGIFNVGGNENTRRLFPRLADRTVVDAGVSLVLPLRLGSIFGILPPGVWKRALSKPQFLQQIPLRWVRQGSRARISIEPGIPARAMSAFDEAAPGDWHPLYDSEYVEWQLGRCPAMQCWTCSISSESPVRTAALLWRSRSSSAYWRLALCGARSDLEKIQMVVGAIVSFVYAQRGVALFAVASHLENDLADLLVRQGFLRRRARLPFYAMRGRRSELPMDEFGVLSYLDSDLAYRFEGDSDEK